MLSKSLTAGLALGLLASTGAWADNFYCGTHIIAEGLTKDEVIQRCGQPTEQQGDTWVYDRGPDELDIQLHFDGEAQVERITELDQRGEE